ncbi:MAG: ABC transporter transmembrane domain-containing protein [Candidatus Bathyarchaeia archaeon]
MMKILLDEVFMKRNVEILIYVVIAFISVYGINAILGALQNYILSFIGQKIIYNIRVKVYEHLQSLSLGFYDKMDQAGPVKQR